MVFNFGFEEPRKRKSFGKREKGMHYLQRAGWASACIVARKNGKLRISKLITRRLLPATGLTAFSNLQLAVWSLQQS